MELVLVDFLVVAIQVDVLAAPIVGFVAKDAFAKRQGLSTFHLIDPLFA